MYLKKLEIFGFKSFADKTVFNFGPGITAIIGPNGCGKSNVFDAIRWVLGEQSVKELRGSSMEDVIFNGTDKKPALGFAEVSLTFSNESRTLPYDYNEVTVTRKLFRSGESEYLINKTVVRLKDIAEMFMGTGIGAEAYSMVQQGRVDLVVSARPEDRRIILDEASGITKYKSKRREALNRLRDTENNLLRINDIIAEVKRQIATCERQAKKAQRYKEEFDKLKTLEVRYARHEIAAHQRRREETHERIEQMRAREVGLQQELEEFKNVLEHELAMLEEYEERINTVKADQIKIDGQIDVDQRQIGFNEERLENISVTRRRIQDTLSQLAERIAQQQAKIDEVNGFLAGLDAAIADDARRLEARREQLRGIHEVVAQAHDHIRQNEERILVITSDQVKVKNRLTESMKQVQGGLARQRRLEIEQGKVSAEKTAIDQRLANVCRRIDEVTGEVAGLRSQLSGNRTVAEGIQAQAAELDHVIAERDRNKLFLISQKEFIEKLSAQYEDIPDPVVQGRFFANRAPMAHHTGMIGKVRQVNPVETERLGQLAHLFGESGQALYEIICETKFIELDPVQISGRIQELTVEIEQKTAERRLLEGRQAEVRAVITRVEAETQERETALSILHAQRGDIEAEVAKLQQELELVEVELDEVRTTLEAHHQAEEVLSHQLQELTAGLEEAQRAIKEQQEMIRVKGLEREETTVAIAQLEVEVNSVEGRRSSHLENLRIFHEALAGARSETERLTAELAELGDKEQRYHQDMTGIHDEIARLKDEREGLQATLLQHQREKVEVAQRTQSLKTNIEAYTRELEEIRSSLHQEQMGEQEMGFKEKEIRDRLWQAYRIDLNAEAVGAAEVGDIEGVALEGPLDAHEVGLVIERLRRRCESFGSVNLVAIEEFEELKQRFEFLTKQQADLITAKESLHRTIQKINRETRQMFLNTFTKVSEEFRIYFRMLFGGGEAQLVLLDPENVLESGIDIIARPPGKKRQNISLLSGGEKTLTAIALIFGVFKVNPSPFCVLDEIDAALDESNVGRYSYLLKDFAKIAQFIVITHNKKTIVNANVMYGITMQQTGVSKLVSVKFSDKEKVSIDDDLPASLSAA